MNTDLKTFIFQLADLHPHMRVKSLVEEIRKWEIRRQLDAEQNYHRLSNAQFAYNQQNFMPLGKSRAQHMREAYEEAAARPKRGWWQRFVAWLDDVESY